MQVLVRSRTGLGLLGVAVCAMSFCMQVSAIAQDTNEINEKLSDYSQMAKTVCLANDEATFERFKYEMDGEGNLRIKGLKPGLDGDITISKEKINGSSDDAALYVDEQLRSEVDKATRDCMLEFTKLVIGYLKES